MTDKTVHKPSVWEDLNLVSTFRGRGYDMPFFRCVFDYTLLQYMQDVKGKSILDIGSGEGRFCRTLQSKGAKRVMGVDLSSAMIRYAQVRDKTNSNCEYSLGDARDLPFIDEFDFVTATDVLLYTQTLDEFKSMCRGFYKNLKPGGKFIGISISCMVDDWEEWGSSLSKYGVASYSNLPPIDDVKRIQLIGKNVNENEPPFSATLYLFEPEMYEIVFKEAGFKYLEFKPTLLDPEVMKEYPEGFWDVYKDKPNHLCYIAEK